jgi:hypothetical protein
MFDDLAVFSMRIDRVLPASEITGQCGSRGLSPLTPKVSRTELRCSARSPG